jgi:hypothetical protein
MENKRKAQKPRNNIYLVRRAPSIIERIAQFD